MDPPSSRRESLDLAPSSTAASDGEGPPLGDVEAQGPPRTRQQQQQQQERTVDGGASIKIVGRDAQPTKVRPG
jgi:hypothetical protein